MYDITKLEFFTNTKDATPLPSKSNVIYQFSCPGCNTQYIGKTERPLYERTLEHAWSDKNSAIRKHIDTCNGVAHIIGINNLLDDVMLGTMKSDYHT